jgi:hypothetical protein
MKALSSKCHTFLKIDKGYLLVDLIIKRTQSPVLPCHPSHQG